jgi:hypothetical protein
MYCFEMRATLSTGFYSTYSQVALPGDWRTATVVPVHKGGDRSLVTNYRLVSLTSIVCKQMEHAIALNLCQVWEKK